MKGKNVVLPWMVTWLLTVIILTDDNHELIPEISTEPFLGTKPATAPTHSHA
jgi:hypothetical protein